MRPSMQASRSPVSARSANRFHVPGRRRVEMLHRRVVTRVRWARTAPWVILREPAKLRWGGDLRRHYLFAPLARRTRAIVGDGCTTEVVKEVVPTRRWFDAHPYFVSPELLPLEALAFARRRVRFHVLDVHDEPLLQQRSLGLDISSERERE